MIDVISSDPDVIAAMLFIWSVILGITIALFISFYHRKVVGSFFRALVKAEAFDADSAVTLDQINQGDNDGVVYKLESSHIYRDIVTIINPDGTEANKQEKTVITEETKFYIPEEQIARIRSQWGESNENLLVLVGGVVGIIILGILLTVVAVSGIASL